MKFFTVTILAMVSGALAMPVAAPNGGTINYEGLKGPSNTNPQPYKPSRPCLPSQQCRGKN
ncbi:hypothetical protein IWW34DRAFT_127382 [Fusarium oxysporum f. sp. albedinis]|uniref:Uncharacterized protein n=1 Tax=Fusarium oxysporum f. sp. melonis 26406 TaxID=1089452 RepID=X0B004_FUSOX|nr:hypothetical protein FOMG_02269 [Fusarium oxysporum f. sp. melonis 26406]EXL41339.1 hypothetical protein FOCG_16150 [Fusarium oxysporum f. sp. radicis-lycopersici 26381]KAH7493398.1 hypothetical protein FOMA001_g2028 [Fusarium oxysporum f. sp. matthiolae]KAI3574481.1 hypothetical protein IWW34DRAFT_127382 [Fusarium oxysporum f. sp. albedinis]KAJ4125745.1 hypothetical protein NW765_001519 [Fusarium oxysporum]